MISEEWKPVVGWEEGYEVSSLGNVRSIDRLIQSTAHGKECSYFKRGRVLKQSKDRENRPRVHLSINGRRKYVLVSRLVARAFLGDVPEKCIVCHGEQGCTVNTVHNLRYDTYTANAQDRQRENPVQGERAGNSKLTEQMVREIRELHNEGWSQVALSQQFGHNQGHIGKIVRGELWSHID